MSEFTGRYALPLLQPGQAQKEVTHNGAVAAIDTLLHLAVASQSASAPPMAPTFQTSWIIAAAPTGIWTGRAGMIASFDEAGWHYATPRIGCLAWIEDEGVHAIYTSGGWRSDAWPVRSLKIGERMMFGAEPDRISAVSGGSVVDAEARAALGNVINALRAMGIIAAD